MGETAYLFVTNPINDVMIMNDLVEDIGMAVHYYTDGNCTSLYNLYQQALQEESTAEDDLKNYPGVTKEDAQEIFDKVFSLKTVIDFAVGLIPVKSGKGVVFGTAFFSYKIYSAVVGIGEICKYTNAYMISLNKAQIYSSKIFKRRVIKYLYEQGCIGDEGGEEPPSTPKLISPENGSIFDHYPRSLTLDWESSSGPGIITYVLEHGFTWCFSHENLYDMGEWGAGCTCFYPLRYLSETSYSFDFVGAQPGRWRVKAESEYGESEWSEWFYFRFWI